MTLSASLRTIAQTQCTDQPFLAFNQSGGWESRIGQYISDVVDIDFDLTGTPPITLTDQYENDGLVFTDGDDLVISNSQIFPGDGKGVQAVGDEITIEFTSTQGWIGFNVGAGPAGPVPRDIVFYAIDLYLGTELIYTCAANNFAATEEATDFGGLVTRAGSVFSPGSFFDRAVISIVTTGEFGGLYIDNLRFGTAPIPQWRAINLGVIGGLDNSRAYAINDEAQIVGVCSDFNGEYTDPPAAGDIAFVWLNEAEFGLSAQVMHDLNAIASTGCAVTIGDSIARDINAAGQIAGEVFTGGAQHGFLWDLEGAQCMKILPLVQNSVSAEFSGAIAIIDDPDPIIVGYTDTLQFCNDISGATQSVAFQLPADLDALPASIALATGDLLMQSDEEGLIDYPSGKALDVNAPAGLVIVAGWSDACIIDKADDCTGLTRDPLWWDDPAPAVADNFSMRNSEVRGLNDAGMMVGWADTTQNPCRRAAALWITPDGTIEELPLDPATDEAISNAINEQDANGIVRAVGQNITTALAHLWIGTPNQQGGFDWMVLNIDDVHDIAIDNPCPPFCPGWTQLTEATDLNNAGEMVGYGEFGADFASDETRGFYIREFNTCGAADIYPVTGGDCEVGPGDLAELNSQWTSAQNQTCVNIGCPPYCSADFDQSCSVGPEDLAVLLAAWGPCDELDLGGQCGGSEGFGGDGGGSTGTSYSLAEALSMLGFSDIESAIEGYAAATPDDIAAWQLIIDSMIDG